MYVPSSMYCTCVPTHLTLTDAFVPCSIANLHLQSWAALCLRHYRGTHKILINHETSAVPKSCIQVTLKLGKETPDLLQPQDRVGCRPASLHAEGHFRHRYWCIQLRDSMCLINAKGLQVLPWGPCVSDRVENTCVSHVLKWCTWNLRVW